MNFLKPSLCPHLSKNIVKNVKNLKAISIRCDFPHKITETNTNMKLWICCECLKAGCPRDSANHCMESHYNATNHSLCYNASESLLWCYSCDTELHEMQIMNSEGQTSKEFAEFEESIQKIDEYFFNLKKGSLMIKDASPPGERTSQALERRSSKTSGQGKAKDNIFGLINLGNTCFFNSVLQVMLNTPELLRSLARVKASRDGDSISSNILDLAEPNSEAVKNPRSVFTKMIKQNKMYSFYGQQDSHEALNNLTELIEKDMRDRKLPINIPFQSFLTYNSVCLKCSRSEWIFEENCGLMLDVKESTEHPQVLAYLYKNLESVEKTTPFTRINNAEISLNKNVNKAGVVVETDVLEVNNRWNYYAPEASNVEKLIHHFFDYTIYSKEKNHYQCDKCKNTSTYGFTKYYIINPPPVFTLCLKRFKKSAFSYEKYSKMISFSETIDFTKYVIRKNGQNVDGGFVYELYGVVQQSGSLNGGHYTCYVKKESDQWYYISDSHYRAVGVKEVLSSDAYMLFYKRI